MGSDESHLNVLVAGSDGQSHKTVSTNHNLFEEKGEPKRYRTEVLPLTSLTPYRQAKPAHRLVFNGDDVGLHVLGCRVDTLGTVVFNDDEVMLNVLGCRLTY